MKKSITLYIIGVAAVALAIATSLLYRTNEKLHAENEVLRQKVGKYEQTEGNSFVVERISKQMEDIAYQQMEISDKRREEALYQMNIADQMRSRAESEQMKAQEAARNEVEARSMAEQQRELAVTQQRQAEHARNVADTLSYIALGRSLASLSSTQYLAGNHDASKLLAFAAWKFTIDYNGNVNIPVIFKSLSQNSNSFSSSLIHRGGVSEITRISTTGDYVSVSRYGEITRWNYDSGKWTKQLLTNDNSCSFRGVATDSEGTIFALAFNGTLLSIVNQQVTAPIILPENKGWQRIVRLGKRQMLIVSASHAFLFDTTRRMVKKTYDIGQPITAIGDRNGTVMIFGKDGGVWAINPDGKIDKKELMVKGTVTAYTWSDKRQQAAIGTTSGDIYLLDANGYSRQKLVGHRSEITDLCFNNDFLFSSSYDRIVNLWDADAANSEAVALRDLAGWAYCLSNADDDVIYVGDESGTVSRFIISTDAMARQIQKALKRDFTDDEWNYYIGNNVPRVTFKN